MGGVAPRRWLDLARAVYRRGKEARAARAVSYPTRRHGTVVLPLGGYFAGRVDLLTRDRFKAVEPITGLSPFSAVADPDPKLMPFAESGRANQRVDLNIRKNLRATFERSGADYLVIDNTPALLLLRELNSRLYSVIEDETIEFADFLSERRPDDAPFEPWVEGLSKRLTPAYDAFIDLCLETYGSSRLILVKSHVPRFGIADTGIIQPTNADSRQASFLAQLDEHFAQRTACRVIHAAMDCFPTTNAWTDFGDDLRVAIEEELVELISEPSEPVAPDVRDPRPDGTAADHIVESYRSGRAVDASWLYHYFRTSRTTYDDLLGLVYLDHKTNTGQDVVRECVRIAVGDVLSRPARATKQRFDRSLAALRQWEWCTIDLPDDVPNTPQIAMRCGPGIVCRFADDGSIRRIVTRRPEDLDSEAESLAEGTAPVTPQNLEGVIRSWPMYLERGRKRITEALTMAIDDDSLIDTCYWIDWRRVLANEVIVLVPREAGSRATPPSGSPKAKTDLSFVFDPNSRLCTIGAGLMDQVGYIAMYDDLCRADGFEYYLDDFRYAWTRVHNGFEASRLAPELDSRRLSRRVSPALLERFRVLAERGPKLPWLYNQSRAWHTLGLREAWVVSRNYPGNSRRLLDLDHEFPLLIYTKSSMLADLIKRPPAPVTLFATQQRIPVAAGSAETINRVFNFDHLATGNLDPRIAATADLLTASFHVGMHVRRGDYLRSSAGDGSGPDDYARAMRYLIDKEVGRNTFNIAVFSDDLDFVKDHLSDYGFDLTAGTVVFVDGNQHFESIFDAYLMSLCPVIVGSLGNFSAITSLLATPPSTFIQTTRGTVRVRWRRASQSGPQGASV